MKNLFDTKGIECKVTELRTQYPYGNFATNKDTMIPDCDMLDFFFNLIKNQFLYRLGSKKVVTAGNWVWNQYLNGSSS